jgi:hypothetical protein
MLSPPYQAGTRGGRDFAHRDALITTAGATQAKGATRRRRALHLPCGVRAQGVRRTRGR